MKLAQDITGKDLVPLGFVASFMCPIQGQYGFDKGLVRVECDFELDGLRGVRVYAFIGHLDGLIQWMVVFVGPIPATVVLAAIQAAVLSGGA